MIALQFSLLSYTLLFSLTLMLSKLLHSVNANSPISVTLSGSVILVKPLQPSKALSPICVTPEGTSVFLHPTINALLDFSIIALQLSLLSYTLLFSSTLMLSKLPQDENAPSPIFITLFGNVIFVKVLHSANANPPISVTLSGSVILVKPLQHLNVLPPISVTLSGSVILVSPLHP